MSNSRGDSGGKASAQGATATPAVEYVHHLKFPVTNLDSTVEFYQKVFGAGVLPKLTHKDPSGKVYAMVIQITGIQPMIEFWIGSDSAKAQAGYDFLTLAVKDRAALNAWLKHLNDLNIEHSDILTAIDSWLLVFEDPDGHRIRFYSLEEHPITHEVSTDSRWL